MSKALLPRRLTTFAGWEIYFEGGGVLPKELSGTYTSEHTAHRAIASFQATVRSKVGKRGKSTSK